MSTLFRYCRPSACAAFFSLLLAGCNAAEPPDLGPGNVRDLRILGVKSTPADPVPGEIALLEAIVLNPEQEETAMVWSAVNPQSVLPSEGAGRGELEPDQVRFAGLVTPPVIFPRISGPAFPLTATAAFVPSAKAAAGVTSAALIVLARSGSIDVAQALNPDTQQDYLRSLLDDAVPAVKILRMNDPEANENPKIAEVFPTRRVFEFDEDTGNVIRGEDISVWDIPRGGTIEAEANVEDESPLCESGDHKDYGKRGRSCVSFSWYSASGQIFGFVRSAELWRAPTLAGIYSIIVVARDRIGGLDWHIQDVNVGRPVDYGTFGRALIKSKPTQPEQTNATRMFWVSLDDGPLYQELSSAFRSNQIVTAKVNLKPDPSQRLGVDIDTDSMEIVNSLNGYSLQEAAERRLSGSVNLRIQVEVLEQSP